jgi:hypothetical protein
MHVPLQHVVGTVALIGLVLAVGLAYNIITSYVEANVTRAQLSQIAENVSMNLVEIISLTDFESPLTNETMMKNVNLPADIGGKAYVIKLVDAGTQASGYYVQAELVTRPDLNARAMVPINSTNKVTLQTSGTGTLNVRRGDGGRVTYAGTVYAGNTNIVVWGWKRSADSTWAGIGLWKPLGAT